MQAAWPRAGLWRTLRRLSASGKDQLILFHWLKAGIMRIYIPNHRVDFSWSIALKNKSHA